MNEHVSFRRSRRLEALPFLSWVLLLTIVVAWPHLTASSDLGDDLTRYTVRLALAYYAVAINLMLLLDPAGWQGWSLQGLLARRLWTLAWMTYLVHLVMAFHYYHHWSHASAVEHTQEVSGFGNGIYMSHFFTVVWSADVLTWWLRPAAYAGRSVWLDRCLHAFMLFIVFNATVVYEQGLIRWAGIAFFAELAVALLMRRFLLAKSVQLG